MSLTEPPPQAMPPVVTSDSRALTSGPVSKSAVHYLRFRFESLPLEPCSLSLSLSLLQVAGAGLLAITFWAWNEKGVLNIQSITELNGFDPVWVILTVGLLTFILGFAGCIGALRENICLLKFFSLIIGTIFTLELAAGILGFVFQDWVKEQVQNFVRDNIGVYREDIDLQNLIDAIQKYVCVPLRVLPHPCRGRAGCFTSGTPHAMVARWHSGRVAASHRQRPGSHPDYGCWLGYPR
ncbi:tetraspanin-5-like [Rhinoraja longicauda]